MASKSGSTIDYGLFAYTEYTITYTVTQTKLTVSKAITRTNTSNVGINNISGTYSGTGQTTKTVTGKNMRSSADVTMFSSFTWTWDRGTSAATKTINFSITFSGAGTSTATYTVTVPALDSIVVKYNINGGTIPNAPYYNSSNSTYYKLSSSIVQKSASASGTYSDVTNTYYYGNDAINLTNVGTFGGSRTGYHIVGTQAYGSTAAGGTLYDQDSSADGHTPITWSGFGGSNGSSNSSQTVTNKTIYVHWIADTTTWTTLVSNPIMGSATGGGTYSYGQTITLTATPNPGYHFVKWVFTRTDTSTSAGENSSNPWSVTSTYAHGSTFTAEAIFERDPIQIFINVGGTWVRGTPQVKINGTWVEADAVYVNINGTWIQV